MAERVVLNKWLTEDDAGEMLREFFQLPYLPRAMITLNYELTCEIIAYAYERGRKDERVEK